ncbi:unnamed protein product [Dracunculus medinensis]|uniref:Uncharacterized protein n=1 Tax=Dracunculus medinensis TaxID=318479 RepID=A0A0N4UM81_DRAME|nr:unnamed protein product [Dracunculus medinensis]
MAWLTIFFSLFPTIISENIVLYYPVYPHYVVPKNRQNFELNAPQRIWSQEPDAPSSGIVYLTKDFKELSHVLQSSQSLNDNGESASPNHLSVGNSAQEDEDKNQPFIINNNLMESLNPLKPENQQEFQELAAMDDEEFSVYDDIIKDPPESSVPQKARNLLKSANSVKIFDEIKKIKPQQNRKNQQTTTKQPIRLFLRPKQFTKYHKKDPSKVNSLTIIPTNLVNKSKFFAKRFKSIESSLIRKLPTSQIEGDSIVRPWWKFIR